VRASGTIQVVLPVIVLFRVGTLDTVEGEGDEYRVRDRASGSDLPLEGQQAVEIFLQRAPKVLDIHLGKLGDDVCKAGLRDVHYRSLDVFVDVERLMLVIIHVESG